MKRFYAILLTLSLCLGLLALVTPVNAASADVLTYELWGSGLWVMSCDPSAQGELIIPDEVDGVPVTGISGNAFYECGQLTEVVLPESIDYIGDFAFAKSGITHIDISKNVTYIGWRAFEFCYNLTGIWVDAENTEFCSDEAGVLYNKDMTTLLRAPECLPGEYTIPEGVSAIEEAAFDGCHQVTAVSVPETVTTIGDEAFDCCISMESITLPEQLDFMGTEVFGNCGSLKAIAFPKGISTIGEYTFSGCKSLASISIPEGVTTIGENVFLDCHALSVVTLPESVTLIDDEAFFRCHGLTQINIPKGVTEIKYSTFGQCFELESVTLPDGLTNIGNSAFYNCISLKEITIPASVAEIGEAAFRGCEGLETIWFCGDAPAIGSAFTVGFGTNTTQKTITATAYYPGNNPTWTKDKLQNYGGKLTWVPYEPVGVTVTGTVTGLGDSAYTLTLTAADGEVKTLTTSGDGFTLEGVAAGEYVLSVSAEGYVTREYPVTVGDDALALDIKLHKQGDVTGDGRVNVGDVAKIYAHSKRSTLLTDDYQLLCADYNGDGRINVGDAAKVYALIKAK